MRQYGLNILAHSVNDFSALDGVMATLKPDAIVVMDEPKLSQKYARLYPNTTVIHRAYNPRDHEWQHITTPRAWVDTHKPLATDGIVLQLYNEPLASFEVIKFTVETMAIAAAENIRLCVGNFAVGNPHEDAILRGDYDDLLRALDKYPQHSLGLHEYFKDTPETPYYIGRFRFWLQRAQLLGLRTPRIVLTEFGRDLGGGARDGWRAQGWSEQDYFNRLEEARKVYALHNIAMCVYCYGRGAGDRWIAFDVQQSGGLIRRMTDANNAAQTTTPPPATVPYTTGDMLLLTPFAEGVNFRLNPNTTNAAITKLSGVAAFNVFFIEQRPRTASEPVNRVWLKVRLQDMREGWIATDALKTIEKVAVIEPTPPIVSPPPAEEPTRYIQLPEILSNDGDRARFVAQLEWNAAAPNLDADVKAFLLSIATAVKTAA